MIFYVTRAGHSYTMWRFLRGYGRRKLGFVRPIYYEKLFTSHRIPVGHYIFTDFDRLSQYEIQYAAEIARALQAHDPRIRILNDPASVHERYAMLRELRRAGINDFDVTRLEGGDRPTQFPVFIRCEDDNKAPDTGLLHSAEEVEKAIEDLRLKGVPLKRRIAVGYSAEPAADGDYRKYGMIVIGQHVIPQHVLRSPDWYVKRHRSKHDAAFHAERLRFHKEVPHRETMLEVMRLARMDYGRIDFGVVNGRVQVYEINSNPKMGGWQIPANPDAAERRRGLNAAVGEALKEIEATPTSGGTIRVNRPKVRFQTLRRAPLNEWLEFNTHKFLANFTPTKPRKERRENEEAERAKAG